MTISSLQSRVSFPLAAIWHRAAFWITMLALLGIAGTLASLGLILIRTALPRDAAGIRLASRP